MANTVLTELKAVNIMLSAIGEAPVNTLTGQSTADIILAQSILADVSLDVQTEGWDFNTEYEYPITPTGDNEILIPSNTLRIDSTDRPDLDVVQRGNKLYSRFKRTTQAFEQTLKVDITLLLEFDQLPESAKRYITMRAARIFADRVQGSEATHLYTVNDELKAKADLKEAHGDTADLTMFDNVGTYRIIDRRTGRF